MTPSHNFSLKDNQYDKYFTIGYNSYLARLPKDLADDLVLADRARFLAGWTAAQREKLKS